jgi:nucleoside 2-deoxyribosyltransferase
MWMMRQANIGLFNFSEFGGGYPHIGALFEVGFMVSRHAKVIIWTNSTDIHGHIMLSDCIFALTLEEALKYIT